MITGKYINKYYKKYWYMFLLGVLVLIAVDWIQLYIPQFSGDVVDRLADGFVSDEDISAITIEVLWILLIAVGMFVGRIVWRIAIMFTSRKIEGELRRDMFLKAERLSVNYYHNNKVGTIMAWFTNDLETIEECFGFGTVMIVDSSFLLVFSLVKMIMLDPSLTLISIVPVALIVLWGALVEKVMSEKWELRQKSFDAIYDYSQENFTGIRVIKAFVKENQEILAFSKVARKSQKIEIDAARVSVGFDVAIEVIIAMCFAVILGFGGWFVLAAVQGTPIVILGHEIYLTAGKLVEFTGYFDSMIWPLIALGQIVTMRARGKASVKRITDYMETEEEIHDKEDAVSFVAKGKITFNHFFFTYPESKNETLQDVNLTIEAGETVGIVGKIGSGKSTLVNSLLRIYNLSPRSVLIDDVDIMDMKISSVRDNIAIVPQDNFLFSDTIERNINFSDREKGLDEAVEAAQFADVHDNIIEFKDQYQTISGERGVTLSGGQKQRISLARAYIKNAPILILDDSVSAVDLKTEEKILKNIKEQRAGKTTLVIASRVSTVAHMDKIMVINDGKIEAFASPKELSKISPTYQKMVYLQRLEKEVGSVAPWKKN
ncbi:MAG: ABC transporter ATP-binding protein [Bacilli bacterium]|nr:ABC transporter ATP-binding protein [Bacilli bacterium]